jgi:hypothetical protein
VITVNCPGCGGRICAPDSLAGRSAKCRKCGLAVDLPGEPSPDRSAETRAVPGQVSLWRRLRRLYARRYLLLNFLVLLALTVALALVELHLARGEWPLGPPIPGRAEAVRAKLHPVAGEEELLGPALECAGCDYWAMRLEVRAQGWAEVRDRLALYPLLALLGGVMAAHILLTILLARKPKPPPPPEKVATASAPTVAVPVPTVVAAAAAAPVPTVAEPAVIPSTMVEGAGRPERGLGAGQKVVLWLGILLLVAMGLVPPWRAGPEGGRGALGYGFILEPPGQDAQIDLARLLVPCALVAVVTAGLMVTLRGKRREGGE